ncbi:MAG: thiS [Betaproteobacteria bacterium]|nr:thiS [Betaproteobacteria bacterium]
MSDRPSARSDTLWAHAAKPSFFQVIELLVNGESRRLAAPATVAALLEQMQLIGKRLAVERNGEIVPKSRHAETALASGDRLEIVVAVGGG